MPIVTEHNYSGFRFAPDNEDLLKYIIELQRSNNDLEARLAKVESPKLPVHEDQKPLIFEWDGCRCGQPLRGLGAQFCLRCTKQLPPALPGMAALKGSDAKV